MTKNEELYTYSSLRGDPYDSLEEQRRPDETENERVRRIAYEQD